MVSVGRKKVDTKKRELGGPYVNLGAEWQPAGEPVAVKVHDFPDPAWARRSPTGHDLGRNHGWVSVGGTDHDTAAFAVATLRRWWLQVGKAAYPTADHLLITADAGSPTSTGYGLIAASSDAYRRCRGCWRTR